MTNSPTPAPSMEGPDQALSALLNVGQLRTVLSQVGVRAVLVSVGTDGQLQHKAVTYGQSVLRLDQLQDHLNERPLSVAYLSDLRDYCDGRLAAIAEARKSNGFVLPRAPGRWEIAHVNAFQPLQVAHG